MNTFAQLSRRESLKGMALLGAGAAVGLSHSTSALAEAASPADIEREGKANVVPSNAQAIAFRRTPQEALRIVYLTDKEGVSRGGFYPAGMNGKLKST